MRCDRSKREAYQKDQRGEATKGENNGKRGGDSRLVEWLNELFVILGNSGNATASSAFGHHVCPLAGACIEHIKAASCNKYSIYTSYFYNLIQ